MVKIWKILLLVCLGLLLTLSLIVSLTIFGLDRAVYSWGFFARRLNEVQVILSEEQIHEAVIGGFIDTITDDIGQSVPFEIKRYVSLAAEETFTNTWLTQEAGSLIESAQEVVKGDKTNLRYSLPLKNYKNNLETLLLTHTKISSTEISSGFRRIPDDISLQQMAAAEDIDRIEGHLRSYSMYANGIMYLIPAVFIALCFAVRKFRWSSVAVGASFLVAAFTEWELIRYLSTHGNSMAALLLKQRETRYFRPVVQAAFIDISTFINPAILITALSGGLIIIVGFIIDKVLRDDRVRKRFASKKREKSITQIFSEEQQHKKGVHKMNIATTVFGKTNEGTEVALHTLDNGHGISASVMSYGGVLTSLKVPGHDGKSSEITLGFDTLQEYIDNRTFFGATIGRFGNRIARGRFELNGKTYQLACNNNENHLHGGDNGFDRKVWNSSVEQTESDLTVILERVSVDGEEGYPGNLQVQVKYILTAGNELYIAYRAETDAPTPVNLTNHTFFNLAGTGRIDDQIMMINADRYLTINESLIPDGRLVDVAGTPFDFREPHAISRDWSAIGGYDHCYVLNGNGDSIRNTYTGDTPIHLAADVQNETAGTGMRTFTDLPGIQFYSGNFLDGISGRGGVKYDEKHAFCLETQGFPDAVNQPDFPSVILKPGEVYRTTTCYKFYTL